jgi:hypothetical protein
MNATNLKQLEKATKQAARWASLFGMTVAAIGGALALVAIFTPGWEAALVLAGGLCAFHSGLGIVLDDEDLD